MDLDKKDKSIYEKKIWVYSFSIDKNKILMQMVGQCCVYKI